MSEQQIVTNLVSSWVGLGKEFSAGAPNVSKIFLYGSHEREGRSGVRYADVLFEQNGRIVYASQLRGVDASPARVGEVQALLIEDLGAATQQFDDISAPAPTEYRVVFDTESGSVDVAVSRESRFLGNEDFVPEDGIQLWLGDLAPTP
ncbi:hypothetical protein [Microbacterium luticocti]|uniref:hypothetical protein n=1 Tax=Microbacterium luticocti TaxID=451764 RepID=UPI00048F1FB2|nr:hypothetical protein [Microbacterium luticocti]